MEEDRANGGELIVERNQPTGLECMVQRREAWKLKEITKVLVRAGMTSMIAMKSILQLGSRRKSLSLERGGSTRQGAGAFHQKEEDQRGIIEASLRGGLRGLLEHS